MTLLDTRAGSARPVEIRDWISALGRRLRLIVIVPLAAGALAGAVSLAPGQRFVTSTTVVIPHPQTFGPLSIAVTQEVFDFEGVLASDTVASLTAKETGAPAKGIKAGISSKRLGNGNSVEVSYSGTSSTVAQKVVVSASKIALAQLAQADLSRASSELDSAKREYDDSTAALSQLMATFNVVDFPSAIASYEKRLKDLRDALNAAQESGTPSDIASARSRLTATTSIAARLTTGYEQVNDSLNSAKQGLQSATDAKVQAQGEVDDAQAILLLASPAQKISRVSHAAKRVVPAMIFGIVLAVGVVVLLELLRPAMLPSRP